MDIIEIVGRGPGTCLTALLLVQLPSIGDHLWPYVRIRCSLSQCSPPLTHAFFLSRCGAALHRNSFSGNEQAGTVSMHYLVFGHMTTQASCMSAIRQMVCLNELPGVGSYVFCFCQCKTSVLARKLRESEILEHSTSKPHIDIGASTTETWDAGPCAGLSSFGR